MINHWAANFMMQNLTPFFFFFVRSSAVAVHLFCGQKWFGTALCNLARFPQLCSPAICHEQLCCDLSSHGNLQNYILTSPFPTADLWMWYHATSLCTGERTWPTTTKYQSSLSSHSLEWQSLNSEFVHLWTGIRGTFCMSIFPFHTSSKW